MNIRRPRQRQARESIVPMINVVFLLLIFFMISARITPPEPFDVTLPTAREAEAPVSEATLYVNRDGLPGYQGLTGAPAMELLVELRDKRDPLQVRGDAHLEAAKLAALLKELTRAGFVRVELMVGE